MEKIIETHKDYTVDENGNIFSYKKEKKKLKPYLDGKKNYLMIDLMDKGIRTKCLVHRLVAKAFIPNPNNLPEIDHIDKNKMNNNVNNLRWCDRKFNLQQSYETLSPVRNYKIVALYKDKELIGYFKSISLACRYVAQKLNCSFSSLQKYKKNKNVSIIEADVTTIENIKIIENLDEVE